MLIGRCGATFIRGAVPVPDLRNLDVYHEIGLGLDLENIETLSDDAYRALYQEKLAEWHSAYPIEPDARFWRDTPAQDRAPSAIARRSTRRRVASVLAQQEVRPSFGHVPSYCMQLILPRAFGRDLRRRLHF